MRGTSAPRKAFAEAISYFEQAIAEDPGYAPAYAGLADSYALDVDYRSIPLTRRTGAPRNTRTSIGSSMRPFPRPMRRSPGASSSTTGDWDGPIENFARAIELNPRYASAHQWYAFLLASRGEHDAALLEGHTAP